MSEMHWLPIETAPKDGTEVLIILNGRVAVSRYDRTERYRNGKLEMAHEFWTTSSMSITPHPEPTHWMSIPPLPVAPD